MRYLLFIMIVILLMAMPVSASNYYHNLTIQVEGEYQFKANTTLPDAVIDLEFEGAGSAFVNSDLRILTEDLEALQKWWSLF